MELGTSVPLLEEEEGRRQDRSLWVEAKREMSMLWYIAGPSILSSIMQYSMGSITQALVGHIGTLELAAVGTQSLVISGIAFGIMLGMGSALETLCGQAYGAGKLDMLGIYMQRSWVILFFTAVILCIPYVFAAPILKVMGQDEEIANLAAKFSLWMIPELFAFALEFPIQKFLQAQSRVIAMTWISAVALVLHVFLSWLCIIRLELGLAGAAITLNFSWMFSAVAQLVYVLGWCKDSWSGFSWMALTELTSFIGLSLASAVMLCLEYWTYMILVVLAGLLKNPQVAVDAASICMNVEGWCFMIPLGFIAAISVRVSNELGAGHPKAAKFSMLVVVMMSLIIQTMFALILLLARKDFPVLFTEDKAVMEKVSNLALFLCASVFLGSIQPVLSGVAVGAGWQATVAYINIACYYLVGLIVGLILGFKFDFGLEGLWGGMLIGAFLQTVILVVITLWTDWEKEASLAKERISAWGGSTSS